MNLDDAIKYALEGKAVLFAGSGFSYGAKNIRGENIKTGTQLKDYIGDICDISRDNNYGLSTIAEHFISSKSEEALIDLLKAQFKVSSISKHHEMILSVAWKRIYTTNYDNVIEQSFLNQGIRIDNITMGDALENYPKNKVCVHLNGYIDKLNKNTINNEFKLTDRSYDTDSLVGKPWFDFMEKDFYSANAIVIIGFSMQHDIDIRRIISAPEIRKKIVFVSKPGLDEIEKNTLKKYATVEEIGLAGLADRLEEIKENYIPSLQKMTFSSFLYEHMTPLIPSKLEFSDMVDFYYHGENKDGFFEKNGFGQYLYLINRSANDVFFQKMNTHKVFIAISNLGNGKTILCDLIRNDLRKQDIHVFTYKRDTTDIDDEIAYICLNNKKNKSVVIIDDYYKHFDILKRFKEYGCNNIIFLLTSRISRNTMNFRKLINTLAINDNEIFPLFLDKMNETEAKNLASVFSENKVLHSKFESMNTSDIKDYLLQTCHGQISEIVLDLFESSYVKQQLNELFTKYMDNSTNAIQELAIASLATATMNLGLTLTDIINFLNIDYVALEMKENILINELFDIASDELKIKSSIISKNILNTIISPDDLFSVLKKIVITADKMTSVNSRNTELLKAIISHSNFIIYTKNQEGISAIIKFYNDIRNTSFCQKSPFFWEQFASSCIDANQFDMARQCLENAFSFAKCNPGFVPFQIETIYAHYLISKLDCDSNTTKLSSDSIISTIKEASDRLLKHYDHVENSHFFIFKVWDVAVNIISENIDNFNPRELSIVLETMVHMNNYFKNYKSSNESSFYQSIIKWEKNINDCIERIKNYIKKIPQNNKSK